jgi:hypothetical protein
MPRAGLDSSQSRQYAEPAMTDSSSLPRLRSAAVAWLGLGAFLTLLGGALPASGADVGVSTANANPPTATASRAPITEPAARFPYDPVCAWGRVADGRGLIVRCLDQNEAQRLVSAPAAAPVPAGAAPASAVPATSIPAGVKAPVVAPPAMPATPGRRVVVTDVSPAQADTGELPEAAPQLRRPLERYVRCVQENGGLEGAAGSVTLRFLVRERGRAEGVAVKERRGVSLAAAKCIADVVDRRYVGYPAAPIVGATLSISLGVEGAAR